MSQPAERVDLFAQQAAELRDLRAQLAEAKRRECTALCSDIEIDRDALQRKVNSLDSQLRTLGIEYGEVHREFTKAHAWGQRRWNAWRSARRRALKHADQRDAWHHLAETPAPVPPPADIRDQIAAAIRETRALPEDPKVDEFCGMDLPDALAEVVLRVPVIAEAMAGTPLVCCDERHQAKVEQQRKLIEIWQEQARHVTTRAEQAEAAIARVVALATSDRYRIIGQHFLAALDPQEQP